MDVEDLKKKVNNIIDDWADGQKVVPSAKQVSEGDVPEPKEERKLPDGKRVVRTKASGDRVYMIDEEKKTRHWITNPAVLKGLGFELGDVAEVEDTEMLKYQLGQAIYRVDS